MKKTTRNDLAKIVEGELGPPFRDSYRFVADFFDTLGDLVNRNGKVKIHGFGTFQCLQKSERMGRNPKTQESSVITARRVVSFVAGGRLKRSVTLADRDRSDV